jgi:methylated-DNA-[protein]-cysteine S-methyltransferase
MYYTVMPSLIGPLLVAAGNRGIHSIRFARSDEPADPDHGWRRDDHLLREAVRQLEAWFAGKIRQFDLPLAPAGTPFQLRVWEELRKVPYGTTASYAEIAARIGQPAATRAVGAANGRNPIPIIVPCHRIIGSNGTLTGYAGGLTIKRMLLALEAGEDPARIREIPSSGRLLP